MGDLSATDQQVEEAAKKCGCHEFIMALPNGYDTVVGSAGGHLSGGEQQRISIARTMLKNSPIVILDEATAYTDPENEAFIQKSVAKLVQEKTLIVIAYRLSTVVDADRIFVISDGVVAEEGTQGILTSCVITIMILIYDWRIGLIAVAGMVLFFAANSFLQKRARVLSPRKTASDERVVEKVLEYVQGISEVRSYNMTGSVSKELNDAIDEKREINTTMELKMVPWMQIQALVLKLMEQVGIYRSFIRERKEAVGWKL